MDLENIKGKELFYKSSITNCYTKFKVKSFEVKISFVVNKLYGDVILISENGKKYNLDNDRICLNPLDF